MRSTAAGAAVGKERRQEEQNASAMDAICKSASLTCNARQGRCYRIVRAGVIDNMRHNSKSTAKSMHQGCRFRQSIGDSCQRHAPAMARNERSESIQRSVAQRPCTLQPQGGEQKNTETTQDRRHQKTMQDQIASTLRSSAVSSAVADSMTGERDRGSGEAAMLENALAAVWRGRDCQVHLN